jgi:hypothetical protein
MAPAMLTRARHRVPFISYRLWSAASAKLIGPSRWRDDRAQPSCHAIR